MLQSWGKKGRCGMTVVLKHELRLHFHSFSELSRKSCVKGDKRSSRKQEQIKGIPGSGTAQLNRAYPPVFRDEGRYARAA